MPVISDGQRGELNTEILRRRELYSHGRRPEILDCGPDGDDDPVCVPWGRNENSPALQCRGRGDASTTSPVGTVESMPSVIIP
jgi:hypothetical protein